MQPLLPLLAAAPVLLAVAYSDLRYLRIPNALSLALVLIFLGACLIAPPPDLALRIGLAAATLSIGALAFLAGLVGAGDVKILAAMLLLVPGAGLLAVPLVFAGALALTLAGVLAWRRLPAMAGTHWAGLIRGPQFPMGVAIGLTGLALPWVVLALR
jgi:prepilin peptidase CpaA